MCKQYTVHGTNDHAVPADELVTPVWVGPRDGSVCVGIQVRGVERSLERIDITGCAATHFRACALAVTSRCVLLLFSYLFLSFIYEGLFNLLQINVLNSGDGFCSLQEACPLIWSVLSTRLPDCMHLFTYVMLHHINHI